NTSRLAATRQRQLLTLPSHSLAGVRYGPRADVFIKNKSGPLLRSPPFDWLCWGYCPSRLLIISSTLALTASRLKEAGACIGGNSMAVCANLATYCWTITNRQNSLA